MNIYMAIFAAFFKIGLFGFGGGYAMLPLITHEIVDAPHQWLSMAEFTDIVAISQMTPGPVAINCATYVGYKVCGNFFGALLATTGVCLPPLMIMLLISRFYLSFRNNRYMEMAFCGLKPAIIGMIAAAAFLMMNRHNFIDQTSILIFVVSFIATFKKLDSILLILISGLAGWLIYG